MEWHDSHAIKVGTWLFVAVGLPLTVVLLPTVVSPFCEWQLAQFVVLLFAEWFIVQFGAANPPVPVLVAEWQAVHSSVVDTWLDIVDLFTGITSAAVPNVCPPWQVEHPVVIPA